VGSTRGTRGFHGLEPRLVLGYSSQGGNGFGVIERFRPDLGSPRYDASDVFTLNGAELLPCPAANPSPSCTAGGTHTTKVESEGGVGAELAGDGHDDEVAPVGVVPGRADDDGGAS